jgi:uncharacterized protein (DUF1810 family)
MIWHDKFYVYISSLIQIDECVEYCNKAFHRENYFGEVNHVSLKCNVTAFTSENSDMRALIRKIFKFFNRREDP